MSSACERVASALTATHTVWKEQVKVLDRVEDAARQVWREGHAKHVRRNEVKELINQYSWTVGTDLTTAMRVNEWQCEVEDLTGQISRLHSTWHEHVTAAKEARRAIRDVAEEKAAKVNEDGVTMFSLLNRAKQVEAFGSGQVTSVLRIDVAWLDRVSTLFANTVAAPTVPPGGWSYPVGDGIEALTCAADGFDSLWTSGRESLTGRASWTGSVAVGVAKLIREADEAGKVRFNLLTRRIDGMKYPPDTLMGAPPPPMPPAPLSDFDNTVKQWNSRLNPAAKGVLAVDASNMFAKTSAALADYNRTLTLGQNIRAIGTGRAFAEAAEFVDVIDGGFVTNVTGTSTQFGRSATLLTKFGLVAPLSAGFSALSLGNNLVEGNKGKALADGVALGLSIGAILCTGPVGLGFAVGAAAWGIGQVLYANNEGFKNAVDGTVDFISDGAKNAADTVKGWFS